jgi:hypothetical protein
VRSYLAATEAETENLAVSRGAALVDPAALVTLPVLAVIFPRSRDLELAARAALAAAGWLVRLAALVRFPDCHAFRNAVVICWPSACAVDPVGIRP